MHNRNNGSSNIGGHGRIQSHHHHGQEINYSHSLFGHAYHQHQLEQHGHHHHYDNYHEEKHHHHPDDTPVCCTLV